MRITYTTCVKILRRICSWPFSSTTFNRAAVIRLSQLSRLSINMSACVVQNFALRFGIPAYQPSRYDAATPTSRDFAGWKRRRSGARETSILRCVSHPHANYPQICAPSLSPSEWNYRYYCSRREREKRALLPRENTERRALRIHGNCRGWVTRCVGCSL